MVVFFPKAPEKAERKLSSYARGITLSDVESLRGRVPHVRYFEMHSNLGDRDVRFEGQTPKRADLVGGNSDFLPAFAMRLAAGRSVGDEDLLGRRRVAVLGNGVALALFSSAEEALGRIVRVGVESYRVVGVTAKVKRFGVHLGFDWNDFVLVPVTAAAGVQAGSLLLVTDDVKSNEIAKRVASVILADRHNRVDDFQAFDFGILTEKFGAVFRIMQVIVAFIASVALLVGGIGVMNILLVSVSERVREIGIRKAMGASDGAIGAQFLFESALLSGLGGLTGTAMGSGAAVVAGIIIARKQEVWVSVIAPEAVVGALAASILIGVFFGLVPARKAGRLQVVDCLRAAG
jgi:putative ABC transport system permease protein